MTINEELYPKPPRKLPLILSAISAVIVLGMGAMMIMRPAHPSRLELTADEREIWFHINKQGSPSEIHFWKCKHGHTKALNVDDNITVGHMTYVGGMKEPVCVECVTDWLHSHGFTLEEVKP